MWSITRIYNKIKVLVKHVKLFEDFKDKEPADLHKVYLAFDPDLGHRFWQFKDFAADKFFTRLTPENYA